MPWPIPQGDRAAAPTGPIRAWITLLGHELRGVFLRGRTFGMLAVLAAIPVLVAVVLHGGGSVNADTPIYVAQADANGFYLPLVVLVLTAPAVLPVAVAVVAGDAVAGEVSAGTLRRMVLVPVGRTRLLLAKLVAVAAFAVAVPLAVVVPAVLLGLAFFPVHDVVLLSGEAVPYPEALVRLLAIVGYLGLAYVGLALVGVFFSAVIDMPIAAMAATVGLAVVSHALDPLPQLGVVRPWLLTHYWDDFADLIRSPVPLDNVLGSLRVTGVYGVLAGAFAWVRLANRDIPG